MILELKDKISLADTLGEQSAMVSAGAADSKTNANRAEAIEALTALGLVHLRQSKQSLELRILRH